MSIEITRSMLFVHEDNLSEVLHLNQVRKKEKNISLPTKPNTDQLKKLGYHLVKVPAHPVGDVITAGPVTVEEGVYTRTWNVRDYTVEEKAQQLEQAKQNALNHIAEYTRESLAIGIAYEFAEGMGHIQVRDGDRANLTSLRIEADTAIKAENTEFVRYFRAYEDTTHRLTASEVVDMTNAASQGYHALLADVWEFKDLVKLAESTEDLPELPTVPVSNKQ